MRTRGLVAAGIALELTIGLGTAFIRAANATSGQYHAEGPLGGLAFAAVYAAPAVLAIIGLWRDQRALILAGGLACAPISIISFVAFPLLIPAVMLIAGFGRDLESPTLGSVALPLVTFVATEIGGMALLVFGQATYTYAYANGSESGSYIPAVHAAAAITLVAVGASFAVLTGKGSAGYSDMRPSASRSWR